MSFTHKRSGSGVFAAGSLALFAAVGAVIANAHPSDRSAIARKPSVGSVRPDAVAKIPTVDAVIGPEPRPANPGQPAATRRVSGPHPRFLRDIAIAAAAHGPQVTLPALPAVDTVTAPQAPPPTTTSEDGTDKGRQTSDQGHPAAAPQMLGARISLLGLSVGARAILP
jgi:hypothetical protein